MFVRLQSPRLTIGRLIVDADLWPWQGYGWRPTGYRDPMYGRDLGRFGGGWRWCLGVQVGARMVVVNLLIGRLTFAWVRCDDGSD